MFFLIGHVGYIHVWEGAHFDDMNDIFELRHHTAMLNLSKILGYDHPLLKYHEDCERDNHIHTSHPHHHSNLETLMNKMEHKHHYYLWIAFHVQIFVVLTFFLKLLLWIDKTWENILNLMILVTLISTFFQFIGFVALIFVLYHVWFWSSFFLFIGQIWLAIIELASFLALWTIRQKLNFIQHHHYRAKNSIIIQAEQIKKHSTQESLKRFANTVLSNETELNNLVTTFLHQTKDNISKLSLKEKFD